MPLDYSPNRDVSSCYLHMTTGKFDNHQTHKWWVYIQLLLCSHPVTKKCHSPSVERSHERDTAMSSGPLSRQSIRTTLAGLHLTRCGKFLQVYCILFWKPFIHSGAKIRFNFLQALFRLMNLILAHLSKKVYFSRYATFE